MTEPTKPAPKGLPFLPVLLGLCVIAVVATPFLLVGPWRVFGTTSPRALLPDQPHDFLEAIEIPPFEMISQAGEPVTEAIFDGRYTVMDFVFTNCTLACPMMFSNLVPLHHELAETPVRFFSVSVDLTNDSPATLLAHAEMLSIDTSRWTLALPDAATLSTLVAEMGFTVYEDPSMQIELDDGASMSNIIHPTRLLLIGPNREVLGLYSGLEYESVQQLGRDLRLLLRGR